MALKIVNGDYVPDGSGGFEEVSGAEEVLQRVLYRLTVPQGSFTPLPDFGSQLYRLGREKPSDWEALAVGYIREALESESDVALESVSLSDLGEGRVFMDITLNWQGDSLSLQTSFQA